MESFCRKKIDTDLKYYQTILWKAMAESEACTRIGAIIGEGKKSDVDALGEVGRRIGFMYRLADDVEDCLNINGDLIHRIQFESIPLPLLYSAKFSKEKYQEIKNIINKNKIFSYDVEKLLESCFETKAFKYIYQIGEKNRRKTIFKLQLLDPTKARELLTAILDRSFNRLEKLC